MSSRSPRVAILTQGLAAGGGVPSVVAWLISAMGAHYEFDLHDLASSRRDDLSRRLLGPATWGHGPLMASTGPQSFRWGADLVEIESMRYRPRAQLTKALRDYSLIQVVNGSPALALVAADAGRPVLIQMATFVRWERQRLLAEADPLRLAVRGGMTKLVSRQESQAISLADHVFVENEVAYGRVMELGQRACSVAAPGVDTQRFFPPDDGWRSGGHILSVCRLNDPRKGLDRLLKAYALLREITLSAPSLVVAGRGAFPAKLTALVDELGIGDHLEVRENVRSDELPSLYRAASVYLQTSYEEGLGVSVLEAMASGVPVVATETAGTGESIQHGNTGYLIPQQGDVPRAVATRAAEILAHDGSPMALNARRRCVQRFSNEVSTAQFLEVYRRTLEQ